MVAQTLIPRTTDVLKALRERTELIQRTKQEQRLLLRQLRLSELAAEAAQATRGAQ